MSRKLMLVPLVVGAIAVLPAPSVASAHAKRCRGVTLHFSGQPAYHVYDLYSTVLISCKFAENLSRAAYGQGPLHPRIVQSGGRPDESVRGGWLCSTGAGGGSCSNKSKKYDTIAVGGSGNRIAVEFSTRD